MPGKTRKAFEAVAHRWGFVNLPVDDSRDLMSDSTYRFLLQQASRGRIRGIIGGPPSRTFSAARSLYESTGQGPRPIRLPGESIGGFGIPDLSCQERAQRNVDDVLILRFLTIVIVAFESNRARGVPDPSCLVENPCSDEDVGRLSDDSTEDNRVSLWNTPEWQMVEKRLGLTRVCFFQGPIGHRKRRPTCLGTNLEPDPVIVECGVPLSRIDYVERKDYGMLEELWSEWAPGLIQAMSSMLHRSFAMTRQETSVGGELRKIDPGFLHHLQQNHMPYRHDCVTCLKGSARRKQHRRVLTPQSWCLSVDTAGPFVKGRDEHTTKARYLIVGVLSVPILALNGKEVDVPCDADEGPPVPEGGAIDDAEWLSDGMGVSDEPEPGLSAREVADARESWNEWDRLVKSSREDWLGEAQSEKLPKVEIVDFVYVEAIERKTHGEVLTAIGRMHARAKAEGFDVRRLHSDRGREYNNKSLRDWCARHSVHKTLAVAEEHQGNGRAEGAIMRVKNLTRTILEESAGEKLDWPLAAKLAAHELKNTARRRLKIEVHQSLPFNTRVQVISRSWKRDTWESRTTTALVKCPSADMSRGWVVATEDGKLLTTGKLFPSVDQGKVSFSSTGSAVDLDAPDYRIKGKTSMKQLQVPEGLSSLHRVDQLAKELFEKAQYRPRDLAELAVEISKLRQHSSRMVKDPGSGQPKAPRVCNFLSGAFSYGGMTGLKGNTKDHPWVTRYLTAYLSKYTDGLFAGVGLVLNVDHELHRDLHNQKGVPNLILPVVTSGGGLWVEESRGSDADSECASEVVTRITPTGKVLIGKVHSYKAHEVIRLCPNRWHESVSAMGQQLLLVGYTPRSLHKLNSSDRQLLWHTGFTLLPASKDEFWGFSQEAQVLTRYHPLPRRQMFAPSPREWLPVCRDWLGDVRYCVQQFQTGDPVRSTHSWRNGRGRASKQPWTGSSSFKLRVPNSEAAIGGGVSASLKTLQISKPELVSDPVQEVTGETLEYLPMCEPARGSDGEGVSTVTGELGMEGPVRLCALGRVQEVGADLDSQRSNDGLQTGYRRNLLCEKSIEPLLPCGRKVTVCEELPICCPRSVALKCASIELQKLQKTLCENESLNHLQASCDGEELIQLECETSDGFRVPWQMCGLEPCASTILDKSEKLELFEVSWPVRVDVSGVLDCVAEQHREVSSLLQTADEDSFSLDAGGDKPYWESLEALERQGSELRRLEGGLLGSACSVVLKSMSVIEEIGLAEGDVSEQVETTGARPEEQEEPPLQTKIIGADQVRREPEKWIPSMIEEYQSLVSKTGAVQELSDSQYKQLLDDPGVTLEIIPGKLVYVHKTSGRRKSRIVGCGNYCQGGSSERNELYASGAGAESLRLMIRRCALRPEWVLASVDVRTAFLQAPLLEQERGGKRLVTIVRVPSILRETGVTACRFWRVQKALYGLASAPKSWSSYRDKVLAGLSIPCEGGVSQLSRMLEDANLLHIVKLPGEGGSNGSGEGQKLGVVALYVDDILNWS